LTTPEPRWLSAGSTPVAAPDRHPPGEPFGGISTLQPSLKRLRSVDAHFGVRSGLTATSHPQRAFECAREIV